MLWRKIVQNRYAEGCAEISAEVTHEAIDSPSSHRWTIDGDRRLEVQASGSDLEILTKFGCTEGSMVRRQINGPSWKIIDEIRDYSNIRCWRKAKYGTTIKHRRTVSESTDYVAGPSIGSEKMQFVGFVKMLSMDRRRQLTLRRLTNGPFVLSLIKAVFWTKHSLFLILFNLGLFLLRIG